MAPRVVFEFAAKRARFGMCHLQEIGEEAEIAFSRHRRKLCRYLSDVMRDLLGRCIETPMRSGSDARRSPWVSQLSPSRSRGNLFCECSH